MCEFGLPRVIISENDTQFSRSIVVDFFHDLEVKTKFISIIHPQENE